MACGLTHGTNNNLVGSDPKLAALADNGCTTKAGAPASAACVQTHALRTGSPALDAGGTTTLTTDQRGQPRVKGAAVDSGAFEMSDPPTAGAGSVTDQTALFNQAFTYTTPADLFADDGGVAALTLTATGLPTGLTATDNGDGTLTISGAPTQAGTSTVTITATDAGGQQTMRTFNISDDPPTAGAGSVANQTATLNQSFTLTTPADLFADDGGVAALTLTATGLPTGLTATDNGDGTLTISGAPTQAGTSTVTITATDAGGQQTMRTFNISDDPPTAGAGSVAAQTATLNQSFTLTTPAGLFADDGGVAALTLTATGLPTGLTATDNGDGTLTISGTPTASGTSTVTITATDAGGQQTMRTFNISDDPPTAGAGSVAAQTTTLNQLFSYTTPADLFADDGGVAALTLTATGLPTGLTATDNSDGTLTLSGTPTASGTSTVTITATDAGGQTTTQTFTITVPVQYDLTVTGGGSGSGSVSGNGLACTLTAGVTSGTCTVPLDHGTAVSLTATATAGEFIEWSDTSCGTTSPCAFSLTAAKSLSATFEPPTLTVTTNVDSGPGSLRAAIDTANTTPGADTVTIAAGLSAITLTSGQLDITGELTISGPADGQTIDGNRNGRIFGVTAATASLTLEHLTLTNAETTADTIAGDCGAGSGQGGAICALGALTISNSTLSGNTAGGNGGGVYGGGALTLGNGTVADNTAAATGGGVYGNDTVSLTSSILAGNTGAGSPDDCAISSGTATGSHNLLQATAKACGLTAGTDNNLVGQDPLLAALADNGCATPSADGACVLTHALTTGSPALDAGTADAALTTDQRGQPRQDGSAVDIGAFEVGASTSPTAGAGSVAGQTATPNQSFSYTTPADLFADDGGVAALTLSATGLPTGLTATDNDDGTLTLSGTPTQSGTFPITITATDVNGQTTTQTFTITVSATTPTQYALTVTGAGSGSGSVTGNGLDCTLTAGIAASGTCTVTLDQGTAVSLTATATTGSFSGGSDASCGATSPCTFSMSGTKDLTATFQQSTTGGGTGSGSTGSGTGSGTTGGGTTTGGTTGGTTTCGAPTVGSICRRDIRCSDTAKLWVQRAYRGYYGRCAECGGFDYWCERLDTEGGGTDLHPIIAAFGTSREYTERFGELSDAELIHNLYCNLFDRRAERGGLDFYRELLATYRKDWRSAHDGDDEGATEYGLSHIALDILLGAQGDDVGALDAKLKACE